MIVALAYLLPYTIALSLRPWVRSLISRFILLWWSIFMLVLALNVLAADHGCTFSDYRFQSCTGLAVLAAPLANLTGFFVTGLHVGLSPILAGVVVINEWRARRQT